MNLQTSQQKKRGQKNKYQLISSSDFNMRFFIPTTKSQDSPPHTLSFKKKGYGAL
jgi:hypothetical protein